MRLTSLLRIPVFRDLGSTAASTVLVRVLGFLTLVALAHILPPSELGQYIVYVAAAVILVPVSDAGFFPLVTRVAAAHDTVPFVVSARADRLRVPFWLLLLLGASVAWTAGLLPVLAPIAVVGAIGQAQTDCMAGELQGGRRFFGAAVLRVTNSGLNLVGTLAVLASPSAETALAVFAVSRALPVTVARLRTVRRRSGLELPLTIRAAFPFALYAAITAMYVRCDIFLLGVFAVDRELVAAYGVVYNVLIALQVVPSALLASAYPRLVTAEKSSVSRIVGLTISASFTLSALCVAVAVSEPRAWLSVFGAFYREAGASLAALLAVGVAIAVSQVLTSALQARHHETRTWQLAVPALVLNVGLNVALIPEFGVRGALVATSCAEGALVIWLAVQARRLGIFNAVPIAIATCVIIVITLLHTGLATSMAILGIIGAAWAFDIFAARGEAYELLKGALRASART